MQVTFIHNTSAGGGGHDGRDLALALRRRGWDVRYHTRAAESGWKEALQEPGDLVVAAGGDGTIEKVARRLRHSGVPLAILPLGTANNIARSLGLHGEPPDLIARIDAGRVRSIDVGIAEGPWGRRLFLESAGAGILARAIRMAESVRSRVPSPPPGAPAALVQDRAAWELVTQTSRPIDSDVRIDGDTLEGPLLLVEAMNLPTLGPRLRLAPEADPSDGRLDVVVVREADREPLVERLAPWVESGGVDEGPAGPAPGQRVRARRVEIRWKGDPLHADSRVWGGPGEDGVRSEVEVAALPADVTIRLDPGAVAICAH